MPNISLRLVWTSINVNNADAFLFNNLVNFRDPGSYINAAFSESWGLWGGEFGLEYTTDNGSLVYGRVARGQKAGQFTDAPDAIVMEVFLHLLTKKLFCHLRQVSKATLWIVNWSPTLPYS